MEKTTFCGCHTIGDINEFYEVKSEELGKGTYGTVYKAFLKGTKIDRAVKIIEKKKVSNIDRFRSEVIIMNTLDHPNILRFYESFEDEKNYYIVLELCKGGELFDRIIQNNYYGEEEARIIFVQIMKALIYCHNNGISHRDLKPENFLMLNPTDPYSIKVIDFGLSKNFLKNQPVKIDKESTPFKDDKDMAPPKRRNPKSRYIMNTKAGTPFYIAPEVLTGSYTEKCDVWSAGVILYILLCGYPPFYGNTNPEILEQVKKGNLDFSGPEWEGKSKEVFDLIRKMIVKSPEKRLSSNDVMQHSWITKTKTSTDLIAKMKDSVKNMEKYSKLSLFNRIMLYFIGKNMSEEEVSFNKNIFYEFDADNTGVINLENFKKIMNKIKPGIDNLDKLFESMDIFKKGFISYKTFISAIIPFKKLMEDDRLLTFFRSFDLNNNKVLDSEDCDLFFEKCINNTEEKQDAIKEAFKKDFMEIKELKNARFIEYISYIKKEFKI